MAEELPTEYDVIIVGTGMVESIVAAAVSRIGKKILHIDRKNYYGQSWSTFNIEHLFEWVEDANSTNEKISRFIKQDEKYTFDPTNYLNIINDVNFEWFKTKILQQTDEEGDSEGETKIEISSDSSNIGTENNSENKSCKDQWTKEKINSLSRKFNIDLTPKLILSKGPMVKLLLDSEVSRYVEFFNVANILVYLDSKIESVPYSKSDVFASRAVSVIEKRILMRILSQIQDQKEENEVFKEYENKTFYEYLMDQKLPQKIVHQILYSIAMVNENTPCFEGVKKAQNFLNSLGFYGNSPFLWTLYGSSDLLQAFCRLSAVFGGIYCLGRGADGIIVDKDNVCKGIVSKEKLLFSENVVSSCNEIPLKYLKDSKHIKYPRAILITDKPLYKKDKNGISFLQFPIFKNEKNTIKVLELDSTTNACPQGLFVVHLIGKSYDNSYEDIELVINQLFTTIDTSSFQPSDSIEISKPNIIFKLFFTIDDTSSMIYSEEFPSHFFSCSGPDPYDIDYHSTIAEAESIFKKMYPNEEFFGPLPPTIIEEESTLGAPSEIALEKGTESELRSETE